MLFRSAIKALAPRATVTSGKTLLDEMNEKKLVEKNYSSTTWKAFVKAREELEAAVKDNSNINAEQFEKLYKAVSDAFAGLKQNSIVKPSEPIKKPTTGNQGHSSSQETLKGSSNVENNQNKIGSKETTENKKEVEKDSKKKDSKKKDSVTKKADKKQTAVKVEKKSSNNSLPIIGGVVLAAFVALVATIMYRKKKS